MSVILSKHLPLLATAPDGIQKLRGLILELAIRGKLTLQDPNEEPASELLKRIAQERAWLEAEGICKKSKAMSPLGQDEQPFTLPNGWEWARLDSVVPLPIADGDWIESKDQDANGSIRLVQLADIGVGEFKDKSARFVNEATFARLNCSEIVAGDILVARLPNPIGRACIFPGLDQKAITVVDVAILRPTKETCSDYFVLAINAKSFREQVENYGKGATRFRVSTGHLKTILLPIAPLAEQQRIVAKVHELMALCDRLEAEQADAETAHAKLVDTLLGTLTESANAAELSANWQRLAEHFDILFATEDSLDALKQTILQLAVMGKLVPQDPNDEPASELLKRIAQERARLEVEGIRKKSKAMPLVGEEEKPFDVPKSWEWLKFGTVVDLINGDRSKNYPNREEYVPAGVAWINTGHIEPDGNLATDGMHFITREKFDSLSSGKIEADDLVYCLRGATFGKTAFVTPYSEGAIASSLVIVRPHLPTLKRYLFLYLTSPLGRSQIFRFDNGSAQPNLSANSVRLFAFPLPPLAEQHRIVVKVDELMTLCDRLKADLAESRSRQKRLASTLIETALGGPHGHPSRAVEIFRTTETLIEA